MLMPANDNGMDPIRASAEYRRLFSGFREDGHDTVSADHLAREACAVIADVRGEVRGLDPVPRGAA